MLLSSTGQQHLLILPPPFPLVILAILFVKIPSTEVRSSCVALFASQIPKLTKIDTLSVAHFRQLQNQHLQCGVRNINDSFLLHSEERSKERLVIHVLVNN
jgi:hypothetical protein